MNDYVVVYAGKGSIHDALGLDASGYVTRGSYLLDQAPGSQGLPTYKEQKRQPSQLKGATEPKPRPKSEQVRGWCRFCGRHGWGKPARSRTVFRCGPCRAKE